MFKQTAEQATATSFLNCYLRETGNYHQPEEHQLTIPLSHQQLELIIPIHYWSATGRHLFQFPLYYRAAASPDQLELDVTTLVTLLTKELTLEQKLTHFPTELIFRVLQSCQLTETFMVARANDQETLYGKKFTFLSSEQALVLGHLLHPTPKSRSGLSDLELERYSPELQGQMQLHFFRAPLSLIQEGSTLDMPAHQLLKEELCQDPELDPDFKLRYCQPDKYALLPVHPKQAQTLLVNPAIQELLDHGIMQDLGPQGRAYYPTSSLRTLYHPEARWMLKGSLDIKITNSRRVNLLKELERGVEIAQLLAGPIGADLSHRFPGFEIIKDLAYITLRSPDPEQPESGFELVLRENPFTAGQDGAVTLIAGLCQDPFQGENSRSDSRLATIIKGIAQREGQSTVDVSRTWFQRYLALSLQPIMWLYFTYGIAIEAHQQNSVLKLQSGYPAQFYYRDNQGYYYCESTFARLQKILPTINQTSFTLCPDAVVDERLRYYFFINNLCGLINAFGTAGLCAEEVLLADLHSALEQLRPFNRAPSTLLTSLLEEKELTSKANLLTRLHEMDELSGPVETQSVYVNISNPLHQVREEAKI